MSRESKILQPEDYKEPACIFCTDFYQPDQQSVTPIPLPRVIAKLDAHLGRNDYEAAERHLAYWLREAGQNGDLRGGLSLENERMGLYRKLGRREAALESAKAALELLRLTGMEDTVTAGTTWLNTATVYKAFGMAEQALPFYRKAEECYAAKLAEDDPKRGGLYNNMALALVDLKRYDEAEAYYQKALSVMQRAPHGALEQAITWLNLANLYEAQRGLLEAETQIEQALDIAERLLEDPTLPRNGYYAFVCEKCAPTFTYYGRFACGAELAE